MIKLLLADDSAVIRAILKQILADDKRFSVVGEAANGADAVAKTKLLNPDLIIMDINMPVMDGLEATRTIMQESPTAIVIFSTEDSAKYGFKGISAGAIEMIKKPDLSSSSAEFYNNFKEKLYLIGSKNLKNPAEEAENQPNEETASGNFNIIMVGASTGGPVAVQTLLQNLGKDIGVPILLTQHIDASFAAHYAPWLSETTNMDVHFAEDYEVCKNGVVYVAPADYHMGISKDLDGNYIIRLNKEAEVHFLRPAVDPMFISGAKVAGEKCIGILLTGMGKDGADGCIELKKHGAYTICESEESCAVFGMPKAAIDAGAAKKVLSVKEIGKYVRAMLGMQETK